MTMTVDALVALRSRVIGDFAEGRAGARVYRRDLDAIAVELDRLLTPDGGGTLQQRAAKVVAEILAASRAHLAAIPPAKLARIELGARRYRERLRRDDPERYEAERREEEALETGESDEVRMARPIVAALGSGAAVRGSRDRVEGLLRRPQPVEVQPVPASADVLWSVHDELTWEELVGGVPCQGCGRPILGDETSRDEGEPWTAYRERMKPIEDAFQIRHSGHGSSWTAGGGPIHCRSCCPPPPLSPEQIAQIRRILNPPQPEPLPHAPVRRCHACHRPIEGEHVCDLADLPKEIRTAVEAVIARERAHNP
jgi:hypothetical protein